MTQAYNLAILANAVDSSGKLNVATNSTGVLPVANGGTGLSATPSNGQLNIGNGSGFTRATITAGTNISVTNGAGTITIANTSTATGTVTSVATGNGLSGGTITTTGTLVIAAPSYNSVGSYAFIIRDSGGISFNTTFSAGASALISNITYDSESGIYKRGGSIAASISGTWRAMCNADNAYSPFLCVRVS